VRKSRKGVKNLFFGNSRGHKIFVTIVLTAVCAIYSIVTTLVFIYSNANDKMAALVLLLTAILFDVVWGILYMVYVSKLK
jgi:hypothetical protein